MARSKQAIINEMRDEITRMKENHAIYRKFVRSLITHQTTFINNDLNHMMLGIISEVGELADALKHVVGYNKELDKSNLIEELGDLLFYIVGFADIIGLDVDTLMVQNMLKLKRRYPDGWTQDAAIERVDKKEHEKKSKPYVNMLMPNGLHIADCL